MIDRLELLNRQVVGNCSAVVAEGDAAVAAQLAKEVAKAQVRQGCSACHVICLHCKWMAAGDTEVVVRLAKKVAKGHVNRGCAADYAHSCC